MHRRGTTRCWFQPSRMTYIAPIRCHTARPVKGVDDEHKGKMVKTEQVKLYCACVVRVCVCVQVSQKD